MFITLQPITQALKTLYTHLLTHTYTRILTLSTASYSAPEDTRSLKWWVAINMYVRVIGGPLATIGDGRGANANASSAQRTNRGRPTPRAKAGAGALLFVALLALLCAKPFMACTTCAAHSLPFHGAGSCF